tara:strand:+ start:10546 stop:10713 length:168 start_codon:yes stop_codon:yes gene_type:complete
METKSNLQKAFDKVNKLGLTDSSQKRDIMDLLYELSILEYRKGMDDAIEIYNKKQ